MNSMTGLRDSPKAGLQIMAEKVRSAGREGDTALVHISPDELRMLQLMGGQAGDDMTVNPETGLPEAFSLKNVLKVAAPIIAAIAGTSALGNPLGGAALSAGATKLTGGSWKDAAINGGLAYAIPTIGGAINGPEGTNFFERVGDRVGGSFEGLGGDLDKLGRNLGLSALGSEGPSGLGSEGAYESTRDLWGKMGNSSDGGGLSSLGDRLGRSFSDKGNLLALGVPAVAAGMAPNEDSEALAATGTAASGVPATPYSQLASSYDPINRNRREMPTQDYYTYGERPTFLFFDESNPAPKLKEQKARGGLSGLGTRAPAPARGKLVQGPGAGQDDKIPAMLSDGEYVMDAATVSDLGDGSTQAGAKKLDEFRNRVRSKKRSGGKFPPKTGPLTQYLGGKV